MRKIILSLFILLSGCASQPVRYIPTPVKCPTPTIPAEPNYPTLTKSSTYEDIARWCVVSVELAKGDAHACRIQLGKF